MSRRRRRRGSRWLFLGVMASVVILAVNAAFSARSQGPARRLAELSYLDVVQPQVERSSGEGADVEQIRGAAVRMGRAGVDRRLAQVEAGAASVLQAVEAVHPPASLRTAHSLLVATMAIRARAATTVRGALVRALAAEAPAQPVDALADAGRDMAAADRTYLVFLSSLPRRRGQPAGAMPSSTWLADPTTWDRAGVVALVGALRSSATLAPIHDLAVVVVTTDPAAVGQDGPAAVLPLVKSLRLQIVVADVGNEAERHALVTADLTVPGQPPQSVRDWADLAPGQRQTVTLGGLRPAAGPATLAVQIGPVTGETIMADNGKVIPIVFR